MWVSQVIIEDIKAFEGATEIELDQKVNVFIGENNAGKSIVIKAINLLQNQRSITVHDIRYGKQHGKVIIKLEDINEPHLYRLFRQESTYKPEVHIDFDNNTKRLEVYVINEGGEKANITNIPNLEPNNFIYPFFSNRKVGVFEETVNRINLITVREDLSSLVSKIDRISRPTYTAYGEYQKACSEILGFSVSVYASDDGHKAGISLGKFGNIPLEAMGEGVPNLLGLIVDLCIAENKLFLIEEIENDIHPKALKSLLNLIASKTDTNQFVISTHSNIVAKYLGSIPGSKLHRVGRKTEVTIPTAIYRGGSDTTEERRVVLEELGYEMTDYDLWKGWLILEESSAERIINDLLIPQFAPGLMGKLRTISANTISQVEPKFEDFNRLFLFTHLEPSYKNRAWVVVDDGQAGEAAIKSLKDKYLASGWEERSFIKLTKRDFEEYYPEEFKEKANAALKVQDKQKKREAKRTLLNEVLAWIEANEQEAAKKFEASAVEIIDILRVIEKRLS